MQLDNMQFHLVGAIVFTLLSCLHNHAGDKDQQRVRWVALISVCVIALVLTTSGLGRSGI
jgi:hypothetical protein